MLGGLTLWPSVSGHPTTRAPAADVLHQYVGSPGLPSLKDGLATDLPYKNYWWASRKRLQELGYTIDDSDWWKRYYLTNPNDWFKEA